MNKLLLIGVFVAVWLENVLGVGLSLLPGLSAKNAALYLAVAYFVLQRVLGASQGGVLAQRHEYLSLHFAFMLMILLATLSAVICTVVIRVPGYTATYGIASIKGPLIDSYLMLFVFLVGARTGTEAIQVARVILVAMAAGILFWIVDSVGLLDLGIVDTVPESGRVVTPMGEANQTGTVAAFFFPMMLACGFIAHGSKRAFWLVSGLVCFVMLLISASRGAATGLLSAAVLAAWFVRDRIRAQHVIFAAAGFLVLSVAAYLILPADFQALIYERYLGLKAGRTAAYLSSGRTEIWGHALQQMAQAPVSLLVGFGWKTFDLMNPLASHNVYLDYFFNLGIVGLLLAAFVHFSVVPRVRRALRNAVPEARKLLTGFLFGYSSMLIAIVFLNLYQPWLFVWSFTGLMLRLASDAALVQRGHEARSEESRVLG